MQIKLTAEDMASGLLIDENWYKFEVVETETKPSADKQSINHIATMKLEGYRDGNVTLKVYFNSKAMGFNKIKPFLAALAGKTLKEFLEEHKAGIDFDFDLCKGQKGQVKVTQVLNKNNKPVNDADDFAPYNYVIPF